MGQVGSKMRRVGAADGYTAGGLAHLCPACEEMHQFAIDGKNSSGARWTWDGNVELPTFAPSMNIRTGPRPTVPIGRPDAGQIDVCHYFNARRRDPISRRLHARAEGPVGAAA